MYIYYSISHVIIYNNTSISIFTVILFLLYIISYYLFILELSSCMTQPLGVGGWGGVVLLVCCTIHIYILALAELSRAVCVVLIENATVVVVVCGCFFFFLSIVYTPYNVGSGYVREYE